MLKKLNLLIEIKSMKGAFYLPVLVSIAFSFHILFVEQLDIYQFWLLEFMIIPLAGWWTVFLFYEYFEEGNAELLFSYPVCNMYHGLVRVLSFLVLYILLLLITLLVLNAKADGTTFLSLSTQYVPGAIFFSGLAFMLVILTRNIMVPLIFIGFYVAGEYFLSSSNFVFPWYHAMFFNDGPLHFEEVYIKSISTIFISIAFFALGQSVLGRGKK